MYHLNRIYSSLPISSAAVILFSKLNTHVFWILWSYKYRRIINKNKGFWSDVPDVWVKTETLVCSSSMSYGTLRGSGQLGRCGARVARLWTARISIPARSKRGCGGHCAHPATVPPSGATTWTGMSRNGRAFKASGHRLPPHLWTTLTFSHVSWSDLLLLYRIARRYDL